MICPRCQSVNPADATFCIRCGAPLAEQSPQPVTGAPASPGLPDAPTPALPYITGAPAPFSTPLPQGPQYPLYGPPSQPYVTGAPMPSQPYAPYVSPPSQPYQPYMTPASQPLQAYSGQVSQPYATPASVPLTQYPPYAAPPSQPYAPYASYAAPPSQPYMVPLSQPIPGAPGVPPSMPLVAPGFPAAQPAPHPILPGLFGPDAHPALAQPFTRVQALLVRNVSARYAVNKWFTAALGSVVALAVGLGLTIITQSLWANAISSAVDAAAGSVPSAQFIGGLAKSFLTPDLLKLFAIEQRIPLVAHVSGSGGGTSLSGDLTLNLPLTGLLLIPALALVLGGYVAASSDFQRVARFSVARGALMGPFYAVLVTVLAFFSSSSVGGEVLNIGGSVTLGPSPLQAFGYALLWGTLFGALGGWIQLVGRSALAIALPTLQSVRRPRVAGAIAGALVAYVSAILVLIVLGIAVVSFAATTLAASVSLPQGFGTLPSGASNPAGSVGLVLLLVVTIAPTLAAYALALATGAPVTSYQSGVPGLQADQSSSFGFFSTPHATSQLGWYLLALAPAICLLAGGRVAARIARADRVETGFVAGALIGLPLSVIMAGAAVLVSSGVEVSLLGQSLSQGSGPSIGGSFLAGLVTGAVVGGCGGASAVALPQLGSLPRLLLLPFRPFGFALFPLLDGITGHTRGQPRSAARTWIYDGVLAAVGLGVVTIALEIANVTAAGALPFRPLVTADAVVGALLIGVPLLFFVGALVQAFSAPSAPPLPAYAPTLGPASVPLGVAPVYPVAPGPVSGAYWPAPMPTQPGIPSVPLAGAPWPVASWPTDTPTQPGGAGPAAAASAEPASESAPALSSAPPWGNEPGAASAAPEPPASDEPDPSAEW
jgi:hypothetical protein